MQYTPKLISHVGELGLIIMEPCLHKKNLRAEHAYFLRVNPFCAVAKIYLHSLQLFLNQIIHHTPMLLRKH